jgi:hypothetical protein
MVSFNIQCSKPVFGVLRQNFFLVAPYFQPDKHRETDNITRVMTKILDKQKENTTQLIIPDDTTSIVYQPILLFCFLIWGKTNGPSLQAFMATILPVHNVQCLQLVGICVLGNISSFLYVVSSLIFHLHYDC